MAIKTYTKHPLAQLDYGYDLTRWLTPPETVVTVTATLVSAASVTLGATITDGKKMGVMVLGGAEGSKSLVDIVGITDASPPRRFARRFEVYVSSTVGETKVGQV